MIEYFVCGRKRVYVISSEEEQKENSFEKIKKNTKKIESAKKANISKVVQLNRDYGNIWKCAIASYVKEKESLMEQVSKFILDKPNLGFVEVDHKKLTDKISEMLSKNSKLQMCQFFGEDNGSLVSEIEANLKCFHAIKTEALKNIGERKQLMSDQMKAEESRRKAEEESRRKAEEESRRKAEEESRRNAEEGK